MTTAEKHDADYRLKSMSISAATVTAALRAALVADACDRHEALLEAMGHALRAQASFDQAHAGLRHVLEMSER
jgi:hypothetical protein